MPTLTADHLTHFASALLSAGGVSLDEAALVADSLVASNLRGHDSHGVIRIPNYLDQCAKGEVTPGAKLTITKETTTVVLTDGNWGFGQIQARRLTQRLIEKAHAEATVIGTLIHSGHIGRLGEYCELAAEAGLVSMLMANTHGVARRVAPPGGTAPRLGTNPLALGVPHPQGPLILDFGTSAVAEGKVRVKRIAGDQCPPGWLLDSEGRPTTDPGTLYASVPGTILPMGGEQSYKGFGLALMIEIFAGALSGGVCAREVPLNQPGNCTWMMVLNPAHLGGAGHFAREVACVVDFMRGCPRIEGVREILLPGDPERRMLAERRQHGIPLDERAWHDLVSLARRLEVAVPG